MGLQHGRIHLSRWDSMGLGSGSFGSESNQPFRRWFSRWGYNRVLQPSPIFGQRNPTVVEHCQIHTHYIPFGISSGRLVLYSTPLFFAKGPQVWINSNIQPKQQINKWFTITPYVSTNHHLMTVHPRQNPEQLPFPTIFLGIALLQASSRPA